MLQLIAKLKDTWFALPAPSELHGRLTDAAERELAQTRVDVEAAAKRAALIEHHTVTSAYNTARRELLDAEAALEDAQARVEALRARAQRLALMARPPLQFPELRDA